MTLATLPIVVIALTSGARVAVKTGAIAGACHLLVGGTVVHPIQILLDYMIAWVVLAFCGLSIGMSVVMQRIFILVAQLLSLSVFTFSGAIFFAPQHHENGVSAAIIVYSFGYNSLNVLPEALVLMIIVPRLISRINGGKRKSIVSYDPVPISSVANVRPAPTPGYTPRFIDCRPAPLGLFNSGTTPSG